MRGKVIKFFCWITKARITPAYAGKSSKSLSFSLPDQDHPRLCGEKSSVIFLVQSFLGSPPPMRGKAHFVPSTLKRKRITPAYAGKRYACILRWGLGEDHPRLCGEKGIVKAGNIVRIGSPPPMRGKGSKSSVDAGKYRITPAYAGKRSLVCKYRLRAAGSPPPMRGKVRLLYHRGEFFRITPAYAGKSHFRRLLHDRLKGSPPPMRGKVSTPKVPTTFTGITPAYAGKSEIACKTAVQVGDHPRLCGEKSSCIQQVLY